MSQTTTFAETKSIATELFRMCNYSAICSHCKVDQLSMQRKRAREKEEHSPRKRLVAVFLVLALCAPAVNRAEQAAFDEETTTCETPTPPKAAPTANVKEDTRWILDEEAIDSRRVAISLLR